MAGSNIDLEMAFLPGSGSIQDKRAANWAGAMPINGFGYSYWMQYLSSGLSAQDQELAAGQLAFGGTLSQADYRRLRYGG